MRRFDDWLETLIDSHMAGTLGASGGVAELVLTKDIPGAVNRFNTGVMIFHASSKTEELLDLWWNTPTLLIESVRISFFF